MLECSLIPLSAKVPESPGLSELSGGCELTVVIHDFTACNSNELTIRRGQTVEVLERPHDKPDWCLVRTTDRSPAAEGLVPCGSLCIAHSRSSMEMEGIFNHKGGQMSLNFFLSMLEQSFRGHRKKGYCIPVRFPLLFVTVEGAPSHEAFSALLGFVQRIHSPLAADFVASQSSVGF
ncbi:UNVERIFIED_CONTAM: hypothetical protein K2H54_062390 [Gekko kuhli]